MPGCTLDNRGIILLSGLHSVLLDGLLHLGLSLLPPPHDLVVVFVAQVGVPDRFYVVRNLVGELGL